MARRRNPLIQWCLTSLCLAFARATAILPSSLSRAFGRMLARVAYYAVPRIRAVGLANLDLAYGDSITRGEKVRILKESVDNVGIVAAEFTSIPRMKDASFDKRLRVERLERIDMSRGCVIMGAHLGNWEWIGPSIARLGIKVAEIVRPLGDPRLNAFVDGVRSVAGVTTIEKEGAGKEALRILSEGSIVGVLVDQCPHRNGVPARFFGKECWATAAPAMLAMRARVPLHSFSIVRDASGDYVIEFSPEIELVNTGNFREDMMANTQLCQDVIEGIVRANPEQWLWIHRRWKAKPRLEAEWRARQAKKDRAEE